MYNNNLTGASRSAILVMLVNAVAEKERELSAKMLMLERENVKLQAKIELMEGKLQSDE